MRQNRTKRRISVLAMMMMVVSLLVAIPGSASGVTTPPTVSLKSRVASGGLVPAGQQFRVDVVVSGIPTADVPNFAGVTADIVYDTTLLQYDAVEIGSMVKDPKSTDVVAPQVTTGASGQLSVSAVRSSGQGPFLPNGSAFTLVFTAKAWTDAATVTKSAALSITAWSGNAGTTGAQVHIIPPSPDPAFSYEGTPVNSSVTIANGAKLSGAVSVQGRALSALANVEANLITGTSKTPLTLDTSGNFSLVGVQPGYYTLSIKSRTDTGGNRLLPYAEWRIADIGIGLGDILSMPGIMLKAGDIDGDRQIYNSDLGIMATAWGANSGDTTYNIMADLNADGKVYGLDLALLARNWTFNQATHDGTVRTLTTFEQNLNKRVLSLAMVTGSGEAVGEAQQAESILRTGGHTLDAAKLTVLSEAIPALRNTLFPVLYDSNTTLVNLVGSPALSSALSQARTMLNSKMSTLNPADFRDLDNELAGLESGKDVVDVALKAGQLATTLKTKIQATNNDLLLAGFIHMNRNVSGFQDKLCVLAGQTTGCTLDLSNNPTWSTLKSALTSDILGAKWWQTLNYGVEFTKNKNP